MSWIFVLITNENEDRMVVLLQVRIFCSFLPLISVLYRFLCIPLSSLPYFIVFLFHSDHTDLIIIIIIIIVVFWSRVFFRVYKSVMNEGRRYGPKWKQEWGTLDTTLFSLLVSLFLNWVCKLLKREDEKSTPFASRKIVKHARVRGRKQLCATAFSSDKILRIRCLREGRQREREW